MRILSPLRPLMAPLLSAALLAPLLSTTARAAPIRDPAQQEQEEQQQEQQTTNIQEVVVVTASRTEELLLEAPTAITVIAADDIALSPAQNYADLMRGVPGLNVIQTSARDVSMSSRSSTNTLDASQLVLIDGRTVYLDFFGFVAWDLLPLDFSEIEQIEVIRGPGSAVWGANALSGVVNIITKSPRQYGNAFRVRMGGGERGTGFASITYSGIRSKTSFRVTGAYSTQDPWDRPGPLPNGISRDTFPNQGSRQPKFDSRVDVDTGSGSYLSFATGIASTGGTIHTGHRTVLDQRWHDVLVRPRRLQLAALESPPIRQLQQRRFRQHTERTAVQFQDPDLRFFGYEHVASRAACSHLRWKLSQAELRPVECPRGGQSYRGRELRHLRSRYQ